MGSCYGLEAILLDELIGDVLAERVAGTSRRDAPACSIVGVRPQEVTHGSLVRHFDNSVDVADHVKRVQAG